MADVQCSFPGCISILSAGNKKIGLCYLHKPVTFPREYTETVIPKEKSRNRAQRGQCAICMRDGLVVRKYIHGKLCGICRDQLRGIAVGDKEAYAKARRHALNYGRGAYPARVGEKKEWRAGE